MEGLASATYSTFQNSAPVLAHQNSILLEKILKGDKNFIGQLINYRSNGKGKIH